MAKLRWPDGIVCPRCQTTKAWRMWRAKFWCVQCGYRVSETAGSLFQDTHKPLRLCFEAMWYVASQKNGVSALGLRLVLGLGSYHTACKCLHKLRLAMVLPERDRLPAVVEVDEILGHR